MEYGSNLPPSESYGGDSMLGETGTNLHDFVTFGGCEIVSFITMADKTILARDILTISWSIFREKSPVRVCGTSSPKGYVRGFRTIAGSLVFATFNRQALVGLSTYDYEVFTSPKDLFSLPYPDMLPPFDVILLFKNEYGYLSRMILYGVDITNVGSQHSVHDIYAEEVMQFTARRIDRMTRVKTEWQKDIIFETGNFLNTQAMRFMINENADFYNTPFDYMMQQKEGENLFERKRDVGNQRGWWER